MSAGTPDVAGARACAADAESMETRGIRPLEQPVQERGEVDWVRLAVWLVALMFVVAFWAVVAITLA